MSEGKSSAFPEIRLQKYIADSGVTSRRKAEAMIVQGLVTVNGEVVTQLGTKVRPEEDVVLVDGKPVDPKAVTKVYLVLNKPRGVMTTVKDPEGRQTVMDLVSFVPERIYPVGRLDYLSEGLLIMTNDGEVANMIMHPRHNITKVYEVKVFGAVTAGLLKKLQLGVHIDGDHVRPHSVRVIEQLPNKTWLEFRLGEGKNREIRRICEAVGLTVDKLRRVAIEGLSVEGIPPGKCVFYTRKQLMKALGLDDKGRKLVVSNKFISPKKTIDLNRKAPKSGTPADDRGFQVFRKGTYYQTIKTLKERKAAEAAPAQDWTSDLEQDQLS